MHRIPSIVLAIALTTLLIHSSRAAEFTVTTVTELQNALNTAASNGEDDTITVASGTYNVTDTLVYSPEDGDGLLTIIAQDLSSLPILDGHTINQSWPTMYLRNFPSTSNPQDHGADITVEGLIFRSGSKGGLWIDTGAASNNVIKCIFRDNQHDGAKLRSKTGTIIVSKNIFLGNVGTGLTVFTDTGTAQILKSKFKENTASYWGAGIYLEGNTGSFFLKNNIFQNNTVLSSNAIGGGAIYAYMQDGTLYLSSNIIIDNQVMGSDVIGGGMYLYAKDVTLENNYFVDNRANLGGGIFSDLSSTDGGNWTLTNNTLFHNHATGSYGGGIMIESGNDGAIITITNNIIRDNSSSGAAGDDLRIDTDKDGDGTGTTVNLNYNLLGPHSDFASGHSDDLYITNTDHYHHHDNGIDDPRLRDDGHLPSGSPAINRGVCGMWIPLSPTKRFYYRIAPLIDRDGDPRPGDGATGGCDIGADEYHFPWPMFLPAIVRPHLNLFSIPTHPHF